MLRSEDVELGLCSGDVAGPTLQDGPLIGPGAWQIAQREGRSDSARLVGDTACDPQCPVDRLLTTWDLLAVVVGLCTVDDPPRARRVLERDNWTHTLLRGGLRRPGASRASEHVGRPDDLLRFVIRSPGRHVGDEALATTRDGHRSALSQNPGVEATPFEAEQGARTLVERRHVGHLAFGKHALAHLPPAGGRLQGVGVAPGGERGFGGVRLGRVLFGAGEGSVGGDGGGHESGRGGYGDDRCPATGRRGFLRGEDRRGRGGFAFEGVEGGSEVGFSSHGWLPGSGAGRG